MPCWSVPNVRLRSLLCRRGAGRSFHNVQRLSQSCSQHDLQIIFPQYFLTGMHCQQAVAQHLYITFLSIPSGTRYSSRGKGSLEKLYFQLTYFDPSLFHVFCLDFSVLLCVGGETPVLSMLEMYCMSFSSLPPVGISFLPPSLRLFKNKAKSQFQPQFPFNFLFFFFFPAALLP